MESIYFCLMGKLPGKKFLMRIFMSYRVARMMGSDGGVQVAPNAGTNSIQLRRYCSNIERLLLAASSPSHQRH